MGTVAGGDPSCLDGGPTAEPAWDFLTGNPVRDRRNARLLMATVRELYTIVDPEDRMRRALDRAIELTGADRGILFCLRDEALEPRVARDARGRDLPQDLPYSRTAVISVKSSGGILRRELSSEADQIGFSHSAWGIRLASVMAARLDFGGRPLAVLYLDATHRPAREFTEQDQQVFGAITGLVSAALENMRLERESAERARMERQITLAREVQQGLLPQDIYAPPGYDIAGAARVCKDLSGDYYDVLTRADGTLALVVGDVSGHGIRSALHMVTTRALVRSQLRAGASPQEILALLNPFLARDMGSKGDFVTLFVGILDPASGTLTWASAGQPPPLVCRGDGIVRELMCTGTPLALFENDARVGEPVRLEAGDVLFLYTDGIFEVKGPRGAMWGEERMRRSFVARAKAGRDAHGILEGLLADMDAHRGRRELADDVTGLVVRLT